ncbi:MAG: PSD1 and planctomycete cytochrome C domain-containing protein [Planctomycetota bacterium]|nr:PSD1 and planctomycete cytochrome C domain-containing protein [Planctomycetota bacterium]MDA1213315.1 PSD1 and planctomycete cytochrome C domain-containing protein [Planctomycetota bacterium]
MSDLPRQFGSIMGLLLVLSAPVVAWAEESSVENDSQETAEQERFFETHIRPLLSAKCYHCHGATKQNGKLRLDSQAAMLRGGESGPAVVPGKTDESLLIEAINYASLEMPPSAQLTDDEIAALTTWVRDGAIWPKTLTSPHQKGFASAITDEDRAYWAFQPLADITPPDVEKDAWSRNDIDRFILQRLNHEGFTPSPAADKVKLIRRLYFDLIGLPPLPDDIATFVNDTADDAYERLVDRLLDDPRYGEKWARHWLDLVRYAESDGYKQDDFRPEAWRYRDYVIKAFNEDKPYDQFVLEQLAGDELRPRDTETLAATGYLRHWIYEYNQRDVRTQWDTILNDITDVTGDVFLGMSMGCARCHNHKFDPILQRDYYRLKAFFAPLLPRDDLMFGETEEVDRYQQQRSAWQNETVELRRQIEEIEQPFRDKAAAAAIDKFPPDIRPMLRKSVSDRLPLEHQLASLAYRQVDAELDRLDVAKQLEGDAKTKYQELKKQLAEYDAAKPPPLPPAFTVTDVGPEAPITTIPGDVDLIDIPPGFLTVLDPLNADIPADMPNSTGRRLALARWLTNPENPLTTRVIVNRIWQYHFGRGLAGTPSNFGRLGDAPTHPELLDWLTRQFLDGGWRFKSLHRLIVTSATYRQSSVGLNAEIAKSTDPQNRWLSKMNIRRLDAEQIRDAMLAVSGELDSQHGGPSAEADLLRRTIYTKVIRNKRDPLLDAFDAPDNFNSISQRNVTTTPTQSLLLINGVWTLSRARKFAANLLDLEVSDGDRIARAYESAYGRKASDDEIAAALVFIEEQQDRIIAPDSADEQQKPVDPRTAAWIDFCHAIFNSSEFMYVD